MRALRIWRFGLFLTALTFVAMAAPAVTSAQDQPQPSSSGNASTSDAVTAPSRAAAAGIAPDVTKRANEAAKAAATAINNKGSDTADAADTDDSAAPPSALPQALGGQGQNPTSSTTPPNKTLRQKMKAALAEINPERAMRDREYREAAAHFPGFCKDWEQKLRDREVNNLQHIIWRLENGFETALYTGYSTVESCESHQSTDGYSIGKLSYEEYHYLIKAKSVDEAKTTKATPVDDTHTTEIFRWEKGKWFY